MFVNELDVMLWGRKAGTLMYSGGNARSAAFYFDNDFIRSGYDLFPLQFSIHEPLAQRGLPYFPPMDTDLQRPSPVPCFLEDYLPDSWSHVVFEKWLGHKGIHISQVSALDFLAFIGSRAMGALEFKPAMAAEMDTPAKVKVADLYTLSLKTLEAARHVDSKLDTLYSDIYIEHLFKVGTSAGGYHSKAVINVNPETLRCYSGQTAAPEPGYIPMLIKFDEGGTVPFTRIEYSYYLMACDAGLNMTDSRLIRSKGADHFLTRRFDRDEEYHKLHVQTFAAMAGPVKERSYESLFDVAGAVGITPKERKQLFLQMVMNVVGCNTDDHRKNFSFLMGPDGKWHITPVYDFTFTVEPDGVYGTHGNRLTVNGRDNGIRRDDFLRLAERYDIRGAGKLIDTAVEVSRNYRAYAEAAKVPKAWIKIIEGEMEKKYRALNA